MRLAPPALTMELRWLKVWLNGERLVCPWHHACFNITTGDLREPPAFDALEMHFKLYEGYVKETNKLTEKISEFLKDGTNV